MTTQLDFLFVTAPSRIGAYGRLSEFIAVEPPVWSGLLASHLSARGFSVAILDAEAEELTTEQTALRIAEFAPRIAIFSIYGHQPSASTQCMPGAIETVNHLKCLRSNIATVALGTHPSALPEQTLNDGFDYVCVGEGGPTLAALRTHITSDLGGSWLVDVHGLRGIRQPFYRPIPVSQNLDADYPGQRLDLLNMKRYRPHHWHLWTANHEGPGFDSIQINGQQVMLGYHPTATPIGGYASVQTSLGCPFSCQFCCINAPFGKPSYRVWSPENVVGQIARLVEQYGVTNIKVPDEMFVLNKAHVTGICKGLIERGLGDVLNMWAYARIDTVGDSELLATMRRAGFRWLGLGIESGSKHVRDGVEKGRFDGDDILRACWRVEDHGLQIGANYIFGLPDDDHQSMQDTLNLACEINAAYSNFYCAMAYPGSALHRTAKEKGWRLPEDPGGPGWIGYSQHAYESLPLRTETLTAEEVLDFRDAAWLKYHSRPEYLAKLRQNFGETAIETTNKLIALGMPARKHRDAKS